MLPIYSRIAMRALRVSGVLAYVEQKGATRDQCTSGLQNTRPADSRLPACRLPACHDTWRPASRLIGSPIGWWTGQREARLDIAQESSPLHTRTVLLLDDHQRMAASCLDRRASPFARASVNRSEVLDLGRSVVTDEMQCLRQLPDRRAGCLAAPCSYGMFHGRLFWGLLRIPHTTSDCPRTVSCLALYWHPSGVASRFSGPSVCLSFGCHRQTSSILGSEIWWRSCPENTLSGIALHCSAVQLSAGVGC
ncbi:hypothetical protein BJ170DRAFT_117876 [Xylariales sp. AK1849]|nr:hypothetical protein BJ170DRAFT_117876 [Xylariales sp. AK1849]